MSAPDHVGGNTRNRLSPAGTGTDNLTLRVTSAVVLAPLVLLATYLGGSIFLGLCAVTAGGILWEWTGLVARRGDLRILLPGWTALVTAAVLIGLAMPSAALITIAIGTAFAGMATAVWPRTCVPAARITASSAAWAAAGVLYAGAILLAPALLRRDLEWGLTALLFLYATVWMTDIFAFFFGRAIGGPLLWPRVSPKKTWSGAIGGLAGGLAGGVAVAYASGVGRLGIIGAMAFLLSGVAQAGDLLESAVKRRFGAKDASHLIPGHGGLMDRLDGFLLAAAVALLIGALRQGIAAPATGLLVW